MVVKDVENASIMIPVDLQGQYVTLDVNIAASVATVAIQFTAQNVGIYLSADYAPTLGVDIDLFGSTARTLDPVTIITRTVPAGKTEYYTDYCGTLVDPDIVTAAMITGLFLKVDGVTKDVAYTSGASPAAQFQRHYRKPIKATAGQVITVVADPDVYGIDGIVAAACLRGYQV